MIPTSIAESYLDSMRRGRRAMLEHALAGTAGIRLAYCVARIRAKVGAEIVIHGEVRADLQALANRATRWAERLDRIAEARRR